MNRFSGWFYVTPERAGSWHFWGNWDDNCMLTVDGVDAGFDGLSSSRGFDAKVDFDLAEGWHRFEFRTRDISGGYGPWTGAEAIKVRINDGDWILFDERNFQLMPSHPELRNVCAKLGTIGGTLRLGANAALANEATSPAWITGTLTGSGTLSGAFAFSGTNNCWAVTGSGRMRTMNGKVTFDVSNNDVFAQLTRVKATFDYKPACATYDLAPAFGLTSAAHVVAEVTDVSGEDYSENFTVTVSNNRLVLRNAHPGGMAILLR